MRKAKFLMVLVCVGIVFASASPAFAAIGGSISATGSFNNGGARAGSGGSGNSGSAGDGGNVEATGAFNNGAASAGSGGSSGSVQISTNTLRRFTFETRSTSRFSISFDR